MGGHERYGSCSTRIGWEVGRGERPRYRGERATTELGWGEGIGRKVKRGEKREEVGCCADDLPRDSILFA